MNKQKITFDVEGQKLKKTSGISELASGTVSYIEVEFSFDKAWNDFEDITAFWQSKNVVIQTQLDEEGKCKVPDELLSKVCKVKVNLVGTIKEFGIVRRRLTTFPEVAIIVNKKSQVDQ